MHPHWTLETFSQEVSAVRKPVEAWIVKEPSVGEAAFQEESCSSAFL
jgi:hypothetical protein